jgi:hypothetical protein
MIRGAGGGRALVVNLNNGEITTWSSFAPLTFSDCAFYDDGRYAMADFNTITREALNDFSYPFPIILSPTWLTAGEPSLEKKVKQVKMWGIVNGTVTVTQFKDWNTTAETVGTYSNANNVLFSHKRRLNSTNSQAASVGLTFAGTRLELEGLEIEFEPFQMGMKR